MTRVLGVRVSLSIASSPTFAQALAKLFKDKHTGPVTIHFLHGQAKLIEDPITKAQVRLDNGGVNG